ncbi:MAG TPA: BTAD domain-containing putative transcriptional regulator, partial [Acidimicrobiales bacterium]|nr:BTAD domain-containing putative transcriptional regulator [Acidimicrobiales bacterium]
GGALADALRAYCRAEDWAAAMRLLDAPDYNLFERHDGFPAGLPPALADQDVWIGLVSARRHVAEGCWDEAIAEYRRCEQAAQGSQVTDIARRERFTLSAWIDPSAVVAPDWIGALRRAMSGNPAAVVSELLASPETDRCPEILLSAAGAALLAGDISRAASLFNRASSSPKASAVVAGAAWLGSAMSSFLLGQAAPGRLLARASSLMEPVLAPWTGRLLDRLAHGQLDDALGEVAALRQQPDGPDNRWVLAVLAMLEGCLAVAKRDFPRAVAALRLAEEGFQSTASDSLASWARVLAACLGARLISPQRQPSQGVAIATPESAVIIGVLERLGAKMPLAHAIDCEAAPRVQLSCFGRFELAVNGCVIDANAAKPKARTLLYFLALHAGETVHRDKLSALVWPDFEPDAATHSLQVAISYLRSLLSRAVPNASRVISRVGDSYSLCIADGVVDVHNYESAVAKGRTAHNRGDFPTAAEAFAVALEAYRGELLPDVGDAEWVLPVRERYRLEAAGVAESLARCLMQTGDPTSALSTCERGLSIDRYRDGLWSTLVEAHEARLDSAGACRTRRAYGQVLQELGLQTNTRPGSARLHPILSRS